MDKKKLLYIALGILALAAAIAGSQLLLWADRLG